MVSVYIKMKKILCRIYLRFGKKIDRTQEMNNKNNERIMRLGVGEIHRM